jgi:putative transcriptional regulator
MSKLGSRMIRAAEEALAFADGEVSEGFVVHKPVDVKALRAKLDLPQPEFARRYGLSVGTVRDWEQGRSVPDRPAQVLLRVIEAEPDMVRRVLETPEFRADGDAVCI